MIENFSLRPYQSAHLAFHMSHKKSLNLSDPGTGKTPTLCVLIEYWWRFHNSKTAFVMPISLLKKNKIELLNFTTFQEHEIAIVRGTPKQREKIYADPNVKVFLMGFHNFASEWEKLPLINAVAVDEFHMGFKSNDSKRTQSFYKCMNKVEFCVFATGTLIDGRLDSAYPAIKAIEPRYYWDYRQFLRAHQLRDTFTGQVLGWTNHQRLAKILGQHAVKVRFEEAYAGSPEPIITHEICEMSKEHQKLYDRLEAEALIELEDKFIDASASGGVHQLRCRQMIAAPHSLGIQDEIELGKMNSLEVHIEDTINKKKPLIIFSVFVAEQEMIKDFCEKKGLRTALINGNTSGPARAKIDEDFRSGLIDVVVGSPACMAVGYNWQHVDHVIFMSLDYLDSNFRQAMGRADRGTRTYPLRVTVLKYDVAVEEKVWWIVQRKMRDSKKVGW